MQSGFNCEEFDNSMDCETDMAATKDWLRFSLDTPHERYSLEKSGLIPPATQ